MKIELTKEQVLARWKRRHLMQPVREDCTIVRTDGTDYPAVVEDALRANYLRMLAEGDGRLLAAEDVGEQVVLRRGLRGQGLIKLPAGCVRVLWVKLSCWERGVIPVESTAEQALMQGNPYRRGGVVNPIAVSPAVEGGDLELYSLDSSQRLPLVESLIAVVDAGPEVYRLDETGMEELIESVTI